MLLILTKWSQFVYNTENCIINMRAQPFTRQRKCRQRIDLLLLYQKLTIIQLSKETTFCLLNLAQA